MSFISHEKIIEPRGWYYALCSKCSSKFYQEDDKSLNFVCKDDDDIILKFMHSVNTVIINTTPAKELILFDEGMTALVYIPYEDLLTKERCIDPMKVPKQMISMIEKPNIMHLTVRKDRQIVVNNITDPPNDFQRSSSQSTHQPASTNTKSKCECSKKDQHESLAQYNNYPTRKHKPGAEKWQGMIHSDNSHF